ncbi:MAG: hypothetical protein ACFFCP_15425 [Promethearchaeota archaeon]
MQKQNKQKRERHRCTLRVNELGNYSDRKITVNDSKIGRDHVIRLTPSFFKKRYHKWKGSKIGRDIIFWFPVYSSILTATDQIADELNLDTSIIEETREYFFKLEKLRPERTEDIDTAIELREEFLRKYRFRDIIDDD